MHPFLLAQKPAFEEALTQLQRELSQLRTGRASPSLVDQIMVEAYGSTMDMKSVASIAIPDSKTLTIQPWDKSLTQAIEKAIRDANIGVNPSVDGDLVRINLPMMTEENRKQLVKRMKEMLEETRVRMRGIREESRVKIIDMEKKKLMSEDEKFKLMDDVDLYTKEMVANVDVLGKKKEEEIMTI